MILRYIICIFFLVFIAGCISPDIQKGDPREYELPGLNNTTIFYLNGSTTRVVDHVSNETLFRIAVPDSSETSFSDPVAIDESGNNVTFNVTIETKIGKNYRVFEFESPFSGYVAFSRSDGQDFSEELTKNSTVHVVLPENFTTGTRFLGIPTPEPDNVTFDRAGREVLIWDNPYPGHKFISVKYYKKGSPAMLFYVFVFLLACALLILGYYHFSIKSIRKKYEFLKKDNKK